MTRLRQLLRRRDEAGVTILEAAVTLLILSIVLIIVLDFLDRTSKITVRTDKHAQVEDETQRALRTVTQHIRGALPVTGACTTAGFSTSYSNCMRFDVPRGVSATASCTPKTSFVIGLVDAPNPAPADEQLLKMVRQEFNGPLCAGQPARTETLLERVVNDGPRPLFTYFAANGNTIAPSAVATVPKASTVRVALRVRFRTGSEPILLTNAAALRNNISR